MGAGKSEGRHYWIIIVCAGVCAVLRAAFEREVIAM